MSWDADFTCKQLSKLIGGRITAVKKNGYPTFHVLMPSGERLCAVVTSDQEGNAPGTVIVEPMTAGHPFRMEEVRS